MQGLTDTHSHYSHTKPRTPEQLIVALGEEHPACVPVGDVAELACAYQKALALVRTLETRLFFVEWAVAEGKR